MKMKIIRSEKEMSEYDFIGISIIKKYIGNDILKIKEKPPYGSAIYLGKGWQQISVTLGNETIILPKLRGRWLVGTILWLLSDGLFFLKQHWNL